MRTWLFLLVAKLCKPVVVVAQVGVNSKILDQLLLQVTFTSYGTTARGSSTGMFLVNSTKAKASKSFYPAICDREYQQSSSEYKVEREIRTRVFQKVVI